MLFKMAFETIIEIKMIAAKITSTSTLTRKSLNGLE